MAARTLSLALRDRVRYELHMLAETHEPESLVGVLPHRRIAISRQRFALVKAGDIVMIDAQRGGRIVHVDEIDSACNGERRCRGEVISVSGMAHRFDEAVPENVRCFIMRSEPAKEWGVTPHPDKQAALPSFAVSAGQ